VQVGGVEEQVEKRGVVQRPAAERRHGLGGVSFSVCAVRCCWFERR
jgi:hypothetical protein